MYDYPHPHLVQGIAGDGTWGPGLPRRDRRRRRPTEPQNAPTPPINLPQWMCAILPCLMSLPSMVRFKAAVPEEAWVRSESKWLLVDARELLTGDVVAVAEGELCPADLRVVYAIDDCRANLEALTGSDEPVVPAGADDFDFDSEAWAARAQGRRASEGYAAVDARLPQSFLPLGGEVLRGQCIGVVVAVGGDALLSRLVVRGRWPPRRVEAVVEAI